ncbi:B3/B4 domain-containing protein [Companilactobacillus jidongensis]|uniref:B3/B4 domain-containing protein n=1 Tax=Companilactobacillus jidongensis TaxID=2486006 RepID=UPI000F790B81|nr:phenylalanine--tRNA ligase beta subunit-related protein [Companilactobacillus jidongensis]
MEKQVIIDKEFWNLFPEGQINILTLNKIDNTVDEKDDPYFAGLLKDASKEAHKFLQDDTFRLNPVVDEWREALHKFKTKKGARSSIEALLKRVDQGKEFSPINPLVDIYNSISLEFAAPCGGEDLEKMNGDLHLGMAKGGESFKPLGADEDSPALEGEIIYYDNTGAICRCLNWREAQRTMLTEDTKNAVMVIESINAVQAKRADEAINKLKELTDGYFKIDGKIQKLNVENQSATVEY